MFGLHIPARHMGKLTSGRGVPSSPKTALSLSVICVTKLDQHVRCTAGLVCCQPARADTSGPLTSREELKGSRPKALLDALRFASRSSAKEHGHMSKKQIYIYINQYIYIYVYMYILRSCGRSLIKSSFFDYIIWIKAGQTNSLKGEAWADCSKKVC